MNRWPTLVLLMLALGAFALRLPQLDQRPLHTDESVHALKFLDLWEQGLYRYDPNEFHGPTLYYATLPFAWLSGARDRSQITETTLRLVPALFGVGLILLLWLVRDGLGTAATLWAAAFTALSPAMVFYSRYYIHEMLLVFFSLLLLAALWRYHRRPRLGWALLAGAGLGLMYATKETFVFCLVALAGAALLSSAWRRWETGAWLDLRRIAKPGDVAAAAATAAVVGVVLFTSFFSNLRGPMDSLRTYAPWFGRAGGASPHAHPWYFYFERLGYFHTRGGPVWSEGLILALALVGLAAALRRRGYRAVNPSLSVPSQSCGARAFQPEFVRGVGFYALILTATYCGLAYKTPWCLLGFWDGLILLAGVGAAVVIAITPAGASRLAVLLAIAAATGQLGWQAWRAAVPYAANRQNPYVYAHTSPDLLNLVTRVKALANCAPDARQILIKVMAPGGDYWPLPWYLRGFNHQGWWNQMAPDPYAPIIIAATKLNAELDEKSNKKWLMTGLFELRPKVFLELYVELELWRKYVASKPKESED